MQAFLRRHRWKFVALFALVFFSLFAYVFYATTSRYTIRVGQPIEETMAALRSGGATDITRDVSYFSYVGFMGNRKSAGSRYYRVGGRILDLHFVEDIPTGQVSVFRIQVCDDDEAFSNKEETWVECKEIEISGSLWRLVPMNLRTR